MAKASEASRIGTAPRIPADQCKGAASAAKPKAGSNVLLFGLLGGVVVLGAVAAFVIKRKR